MNHAPRARLALSDVARLVVGALLFAGFLGLDRTSNTIDVRFVPPWDRSTPGELYFWLGAILLLLPGTSFIGAGLSGLLRNGGRMLAERLTRATAAERAAALIVLGISAFALARIGNHLVMCGQPFTDDEDAARFGGQVLASGALWAPLPPMRFAFPELFLFQREGRWTSFDFLGALLPWSLSELTDSGTLVFSIFAALSPLGVAMAVSRRQGLPIGLAAGAALLFSPMATTLSLTSHAHVVSRGLIALGLGIGLFVDRMSLSRGVLTGLCFGMAQMVRPPESVTLLAPLCVAWTYGALRDPARRPGAIGLWLGLLPGVMLTLGYNIAVSGSPGLLRAAANEIVVPYHAKMHGPFEFEHYGRRFGNNLSYNFLTLSIWFFGPIGLFLAGLGARASRECELLSVGACLNLSLTLVHDDRGLHMVGPIHLSELAVPLAIAAAMGAHRAVSAMGRTGMRRSVACGVLAGYTVLGLGFFSAWHAQALFKQSITRYNALRIVREVPEQPAIVLATSYTVVRKSLEPDEVGSFLFEWPRARPDLSEPVLLVMDSPEARKQVRDAFPGRTAYVFDPVAHGAEPVRLDQLRRQ